MVNHSAVIVAAKRTPIGSFLGNMSSFSAPHLGSIVLKDIAQGIHQAVTIDQIIMGCVLTAGLGQAPARQAAHYAELSTSIPAMTINNVCGSGLKAVILACDMIAAQNANCVIAGGMESMSNAPYLLPNVRKGNRLGHQSIFDHMMIDGLQNAYGDRSAMGLIAENLAEKNNFSRNDQDTYALESIHLAQKAQSQNLFEKEIVSTTLKIKDQEQIIKDDESIIRLRPEKISHLKPAFKKEGTITAGNASSLNDGAAGVVVMSEEMARICNYQPLVRVVSYASIAVNPDWFTLAPIQAIQKVCDKAGWQLKDVDLFEINEAFAVVTLATINTLKIDRQKVNVHGGACALGHPIGASGARILVTLIHALRHYQKKRGIATLCVGGGEGVAIAIECL